MSLTQLALVDATQLDSDLGDVADAIRAKSGGSSQLAFPLDFISEIESIQTGGADRLKTAEITLTQDYATATSTPASIMALGAAAIGTNNYVVRLVNGVSALTNADLNAMFAGGFHIAALPLTLSDKTRNDVLEGVARYQAESNPRDGIIQGAYGTLSYNSNAKAGAIYQVWGWD